MPFLFLKRLLPVGLTFFGVAVLCSPLLLGVSGDFDARHLGREICHEVQKDHGFDRFQTAERFSRLKRRGGPAGHVDARIAVWPPDGWTQRSVKDCQSSIKRSAWFQGVFLHLRIPRFWTAEAVIVVRGLQAVTNSDADASLRFVRHCAFYVHGPRLLDDGKHWHFDVPDYRCSEALGQTPEERPPVPALPPFAPM